VSASVVVVMVVVAVVVVVGVVRARARVCVCVCVYVCVRSASARMCVSEQAGTRVGECEECRGGGWGDRALEAGRRDDGAHRRKLKECLVPSHLRWSPCNRSDGTRWCVPVTS
jgi:hypothetical protein